MTNIKQGDVQPITFTVNHDLTGATIRLIVRHGDRDGEFELLDSTITDAAEGVVVYTTDGTWELGRHYLELEIAQGGEIRTAPTDSVYIIRVLADLDEH